MKVYVYLNQSGYLDFANEPKCDNMYLEKFLGTFEMPVEAEKKRIVKEMDVERVGQYSYVSKHAIPLSSYNHKITYEVEE